MAGFTVPIAGLIAAGVLLFKLIFSLASTTLVTFSAATLCCLREFNISRASWTFPLILKRASFRTSFSRASFTPSFCLASVSPIFCRASKVCWKLAAGDDLFRRLCWIPMRDLTPPNTGLVLSLGGGRKKKRKFQALCVNTVSIKVFVSLQTKVHYYCTKIHSSWTSRYNSRTLKLDFLFYIIS